MIDKEIGLRPRSKIDCHAHGGGENPYRKIMSKHPFAQGVGNLRFNQLSIDIGNTIS